MYDKQTACFVQLNSSNAAQTRLQPELLHPQTYDFTHNIFLLKERTQMINNKIKLHILFNFVADRFGAFF